MFQVRVSNTLAAAAFVLAASVASAQDTIPATGGDIKFIPLTHATLQIEHAGHTILVDPTPQAKYDGLKPANIILITDIHGDHLDAATLAKVRGNATVIVPAEVAKTIMGTTVLANGETKEVMGVSVEAVPMYNLQRGPAAGQLFHTKGRGNGYVVSMGGKRIYLSGDTECTPEMKALKNIDVAFVSMNLPYTMPVAEAAECVKAFKPKVVYPYHYRGQNLTEFSDALKGTPGVEVRVRDWYVGMPAPGAGGGRGR
jgi:L-ascorbate metabolism protein UlaG (beta-lactamase superfamily)